MAKKIAFRKLLQKKSHREIIRQKNPISRHPETCRNMGGVRGFQLGGGGQLYGGVRIPYFL